ncbi:DNA-directed RNA polymerase III subunit RPC1 [Cyphellophora attinorum]|uniref:DNA-directed RNA polymerase subunit n=1 Tax=Cyphellophora attinorum TaxID=1664694 RepID=A0A0N1P228_9EURO|nr:DNA-directed RNA polymerase III subunit RPC1 [Phialophora attinorum]KPI44783.1 DNA-directed RNA polymerase III subunit RPC1 [Phialophora attinorum]
MARDDAASDTHVYAPGNKHQVLENAPKTIKELRFGVLSDRDVVNQSYVELADRRIFDLDKGRAYAEYGPLDKRMGVSIKSDVCSTCGLPLQTCNGHFGNIKLVLPVYHVGYFKKDCSCILLSEVDRRRFLAQIRRAGNDDMRVAKAVRNVTEQCKKAKECYQCGSTNGQVRKAGSQSLKIMHHKFKTFDASTRKDKMSNVPLEKQAFDSSFDFAKRTNTELDKHVKKAMDDLDALRTLKLFRRISRADRELLGLRDTKPQSFLWLQIPAPPVAIRPSVGQEGSSTEDDLTAKLGDIVQANNALRDALKKGAPVQSLIEHWDYLGLQLAMYINSDVPGLAKAEFGKQIRGLVQRLKGKQGRFRGNLSGKRVDFSGRTVISPDPNLNIDEVAVPVLVAKNMTYPEVVNRYNYKKLQERVRNGAKQWPGANFITKKATNVKHNLRFGNRQMLANNLQDGDVIERHLEDGDIVLFNRQPSLHKLSILSHRVRVRPHRTFRLNECVCNPYNADFDGDEMNLHVPQTEEARTEATQLMGVKHNIVTPKNGEPIISAIQDFITAAYLLSSLDVFYDRKTFVTICCGMLEPGERFDLPTPAIFKPQALWTGKQVFSVMIKPDRHSNVAVNLDASCRDHKVYHPGLHRDLQDDSFLCIRNSEVLCGRMDKATVGAGKKNSVFYVLYRDFGPDAAAKAMTRLSRLCARWLGNQGFSVGISDVTPPEMLRQVKDDKIKEVFDQCKEFTSDSKAGRLKRRAGMDDAATLEAEQIRVLSTVRTEIAGILTKQLSKHNAPMVMALSGSKGSNVNVAQMAALLGQQDIEGKRVQDGFQDRTLPHFVKHERSPESKGFVSNSFFSGLLPYEFLFHAVGGRVGLVDTAVKTAETGYMSRRLMKSLEDLSTQYDQTVRNSTSDVIQFRFGDDELDPVDMEASARPVDFDRTYTHIDTITYDSEDPGLQTATILGVMEEILRPQRARYQRLHSDGTILPYDTLDDALVDQHESPRAFLQTIYDFVMAKCIAFDEARAEKAKVTAVASSSGSSKRKRTTSNDVQEEPSAPTTRRGGRKTTETAGSNLKTSKKQKTAARATEEAVHALAVPRAAKDRFELTSKLSRKTLEAFINACLEKYKRAQVEPGHAVGAVGAQSIGEPGTQMTLKTFHFAGVAGMSLTAGVPRIKEIINASKTISTPVITCRLERRSDLTIPEGLAQIVKGRIESLFLEDVMSYIQISHSPDRESCLYLKIDLDTIADLGLDITMVDIIKKIKDHRKFKGGKISVKLRGSDIIRIDSLTPIKSGKRGMLRRFLPGLPILGHPLATRAVVMAEDDPRSDEIKAKRAELTSGVPSPGSPMQIDIKPEPTSSPEVTKKTAKVRGKKGASATASEPAIKVEETAAQAPSMIPPSTVPDTGKPIQMHKVMVEGYGLQACMNTPGVDPYATQTNSIMETNQFLGIEAARSKIITEIQEVTKGLSIDPRHMYLLADVMTYKGDVLGITRFGLAKMSSSVLQLASFEKTADHVFEAGIAGKADKVKGVSESVIVGKTMNVGTGSVSVVRAMRFLDEEVNRERKSTLFEEAWGESA